MAASAHTKGGYGGVPQSVGRDFNKADAGTGIINRAPPPARKRRRKRAKV
jgi:hypothetical protein